MSTLVAKVEELIKYVNNYSNLEVNDNNDNNNSASISTMNSKAEYLICGYVHLIQKMIKHQIIPLSIIELCVLFYNIIEKRLIYLQGGTHVNKKTVIHISQLNDDKNNRFIKYNTKQLIKNEDQTYPIYRSGMVYVNNVKLPCSIFSLVSDHHNNKFKSYPVIFSAGGESMYDEQKECNAYIICNNIDNDNDNVFVWELPSKNKPTDYDSLLYSSSYGLINLSSDLEEDKTIINMLSLNNIDTDIETNEWKWKHITNINKRIHSSNIMINDDIFLCCGGYDYSNVGWSNGKCVSKCTLYNINENKWINISNMNTERSYGAIHFDCNNNRVYIGGGEGNETQIIESFYPSDAEGDERFVSETDVIKKMEYYDVNKLKWINLCDTNKLHDPPSTVLWTNNKNNDNILYIASLDSNININGGFVLEQLDLRSNDKWINITNKFHNEFGKIHCNDGTRLLLQNYSII